MLDKDALRGAGRRKPPACPVSRRPAFLHPPEDPDPRTHIQSRNAGKPPLRALIIGVIRAQDKRSGEAGGNTRAESAQGEE